MGVRIVDNKDTINDISDDTQDAIKDITDQDVDRLEKCKFYSIYSKSKLKTCISCEDSVSIKSNNGGETICP